MRNIQNISLGLSPPIMEELGFTAAIKHLLSELKRYFKVRCAWLFQVILTCPPKTDPQVMLE